MWRELEMGLRKSPLVSEGRTTRSAPPPEVRPCSLLKEPHLQLIPLTSPPLGCEVTGVARLHHKAHLDIRCYIHGNAVPPTRLVNMAENNQHIFVLRRRAALHFGASGGTEDAHRGECPEGRDKVDSPERVLYGLDARDDLARAGALSEFLRHVIESTIERFLAHQPCLARTVARKVFGVVKLVAEAEVIGSQIDQPVVFRER